MGSSTSKPRKGHEKPKHLPKVGTPANQAWEHEGRVKQVFGPTWLAPLLGIMVVLAIIGLVIIAI